MTPEASSDNAAPQMGEVGRLTGVFFDPKKAFADIAAKPRNWFVPLLLLIVAALAFTYTYTTRIGWEGYIRKTMENNPRAQNLPADQREAQIQTGAKIAPIFGYGGSIVFIPVAALAIGGVLLLTSKMMGAGGSVNFKQMFTITSYAMLPGLVSSILAIIVMFTKNPEDFNLQNPLIFNLGALMEPPPNSGKFLYSLATSIDLFSFWTILLLATGISAAARKLPFSKAIMAVVLPWAIYVVIKSAWAGAFG
jgi:hypothetical protein